MANISDATGTLYVTARSQEIAEKFITLYSKIASTWYYNTTIAGQADLASQDKTTVTLCIPFTASGRWVYEINIDWTFHPLTQTDLKLTDEQQSLRCELLDEDITVRYDYTDYEPGCNVLLTRSAQIRYHNHTVEQQEELDVVHYDTTVENLRELIDEDFYGKQTLLEELETGNLSTIATVVSSDTVRQLETIMNDPVKKTRLITLVEDNATLGVDYTIEAYLDMFYETFAQDVATLAQA
ncbi:hypothetical protein ACFQY8_08010 [Alloscardovia venturai]|uniref:Uncharacterized protein n=1 Tax=Alloscardovia venturai TaxID=1769421 RepID=A0ABW2Y5Y3_9BIFI